MAATHSVVPLVYFKTRRTRTGARTGHLHFYTTTTNGFNSQQQTMRNSSDTRHDTTRHEEKTREKIREREYSSSKALFLIIAIC